MMQLTYPLFETPIEMQENVVNILVIENPNAFYLFSQSLLDATQNISSDVVLSKAFEPLAFSKYAEVVFTTECLELNSKKILQRLHKTLKKTAYDDTFYLRTSDLQSEMQQYMQALCESEILPLVFSEIDIETLLKGMEVKLDLTVSTLAEKVCAYIDVMSNYFGIHLFFFFHLKSYLGEKELQSVYQHCFYQKEQLVLCESVARPLLAQEKMHLIDCDLCQVT